MKTIHYITKFTALAVAVLLPCALMAQSKLVPFKSSSLVQAVQQSYDDETGITYQVLTGNGISSHMGRVTVWAEIALSPGDLVVDQTGAFIVSHFSGTEIETAANGDTVASTIEGTYSIPWPWPSPFIAYITGTRTVTGGTGRFQGATGSMTLEGVDADNGVTLNIEGMISSVGSAKK